MGGIIWELVVARGSSKIVSTELVREGAQALTSSLALLRLTNRVPEATLL